MKPIHYRLLWIFTFISGFVCYYAVARHWYFQRADYYRVSPYMASGLESVYIESYRLLDELKKNTEKMGNPTWGLSYIKEAEILNRQTQTAFESLQKIGKGLPAYAPCNILTDAQGMRVLAILKTYETYIKTKHPTCLPILQNLAEEAYFSTQSIEEVRFIEMEVSIRLLSCEQAILKKYLAQFEIKLQRTTVVPLVQSTQQTYYEGDSYEAYLYLLMPIRYKKGEASASCNGKPIEIDENGMAHITFPVGKAGEYSWQGTFSCKYYGKDTTFQLQQRYKVFEKH